MSLADREPDANRPIPPIRTAALLAIFVALSAIGGLVKIPSPITSIALDSAPGYFTAAAFGGPLGAGVISIGHLLSAAIGGFPLGIPIHLGIAVGSMGLALLFGVLARRGPVGCVIGVVVVAALNGLVLSLLVVPVGGWGLYASTILPLLIASGVNLAIAAAAYLALRRTTLLP